MRVATRPGPRKRELRISAAATRSTDSSWNSSAKSASASGSGMCTAQRGVQVVEGRTDRGGGGVGAVADGLLEPDRAGDRVTQGLGPHRDCLEPRDLERGMRDWRPPWPATRTPREQQPRPSPATGSGERRRRRRAARPGGGRGPPPARGPRVEPVELRVDGRHPARAATSSTRLAANPLPSAVAATAVMPATRDLPRRRSANQRRGGARIGPPRPPLRCAAPSRQRSAA